MHKINPRYIINGTLGIILVFATAYVIWQKGFVLKYGLALLVAFVLGVYNFMQVVLLQLFCMESQRK